MQDAKVEQMKLERERVRERSAQKKARYPPSLSETLMSKLCNSPPLRERETRREARIAALQLSAEELERRIQTKVPPACTLLPPSEPPPPTHTAR